MSGSCSFLVRRLARWYPRNLHQWAALAVSVMVVVWIAAMAARCVRQYRLIEEIGYSPSDMRFEPVVPGWLRGPLGEKNCHKLFDRLVGIRIGFYDMIRPAPFPSRLRLVEEFDSLKELEISPAYISNTRLAWLPAPPSVEKLRIANYHLDCSETCVLSADRQLPEQPSFAWHGADLTFLKRYPELRELHLQSLWLRAGTVEAIASVPKLESLTFKECDLPLEELSHLALAQELRLLKWWYGGRRVDGRLIEVLPALPQLRQLHLDYAELHEADLAIVKSLSGLRVLTIQGCRLRGNDVSDFSATEHLEWLDVRYVRLTDREILRIAQTIPANCRLLVDAAQFKSLAVAWPVEVMKRVTKTPRKEFDYPIEY